jgi:hypothetical protein
MISAVLIPKLQQRFPDRGLHIGAPPSPCAVFPGGHPEVGDVQIYDDGDEVTLIAGNFTHGHFSSYDDTLSPEQKAEDISEDVASFLEDLFADRIVLWGAHDRAGGWYKVADEPSAFWAHGEQKYLWSGPLPSRAEPNG